MKDQRKDKIYHGDANEPDGYKIYLGTTYYTNDYECRIVLNAYLYIVLKTFCYSTYVYVYLRATDRSLTC